MKYDAADNLVEGYGLKGDGSLITRIYYENDQKGNMINQRTLLPNNQVNSETFSSYDDAGNLTEIIARNAEGQIISKTNYKFNEQKRLVETTSSVPAAKISQRHVFEYDAHGNLTQQSVYNKLNELVEVIKPEYQKFDQ